MIEQSQSLPILTELSKIFPDIEGELCTRHSTLFSKIRNSFQQLYGYIPERYIVVNGSAEILSCSQSSLSFGLENGIIFTIKRIADNSKIYINSNHSSEEIIFSNDGKDCQGLHPSLDKIKKCLQLATEDLSISKLSGGIIYYYANIPQDHFHYSNALLIGIYLSFLIINDNLKNYTVSDLIQNLLKTQLNISRNSLVKSFYYYNNRQFCLQVGKYHENFNFNQKIKFVLCKFDVGVEDIHFQQDRKTKINQQKLIVYQQIKHKYNISSTEQLMENKNINWQISQFPSTTDIANSNYLLFLIKQMTLMCEFSNGKISINQLIKQKWQIDSKYWKFYKLEFVNFIENIKQELDLDGICVIQGQFLLIVTDKYKFTDTVCKLRNKTSKGQMKSNNIIQGQQQVLQHRWGKDARIGQKLFSSLPSRGISVLNPVDSIWFDG